MTLGVSASPVPAQAARPRPLALTDLEGVELNHANQQLLTDASRVCGGPPPWRARKLAEAREVLALSQLSRRFTVAMIDMADALRLLVHTLVPVPVRPHPGAAVEVAPYALLGVTYRQCALSAPQPGMSFIQILSPQNILHPNCVADSPHTSLICLGPTLPAGIRVTELLKICYGALAMQIVQFNPGDAAGVLNVEAAEYWQRNVDKLPLTREPFLRPSLAPNP